MTAARIQSLGGQLARPSMCAFSVMIDDQVETFNAGTANTAVPYNSNGTVLFDRNNDYDLANNKFTAPVTGLYQLNFKLRIENVTAGQYIVSFLTEPGYTGNGGAGSVYSSRTIQDIIYSQTYNIRNAGTYNTLEANALLYLASGQEVQHGARIESDTSVRLSDRACMFNGYFVG
jgi:hypothetical protein